MRRTTAALSRLYAHAVLVRRARRLLSVDALIAAAFVVADAIEAIVRHRDQPLLLSIDLAGAPLLWCVSIRRRRPLLAIAILTAGAAFGTLLEVLFSRPHPGSADALIPIFAMLLLIYSLGAYGSTRELAMGGTLPLLLVLGIDLSEPTSNALPGALLFFAVFIVGLPALAGRLVKFRRSLVGQLQEQERRLEQERSMQARSELALERARISDRLHGSLAAGLKSLARRASEASHVPSESGADLVATLESDARALLAETRGVVVALASENYTSARVATPASTDGVVTPRDRARSSLDPVQPWFVVAGAAVSVGLMFETRTSSQLHAALPIALVACLAVGLPLGLLWMRPLLMISAMWAAASLFAALVTPLGPMFTPIALSFLSPFAVACFAPRPPAVIGLGVCFLGEVAVFGPDALPSNVLFVVAAWAAGRIVQDSTRLISTLRSNRARLDQQHEAQLRESMLQERARYARDLHDSVGHTLTVIALQAGAARRMWRTDRGRAVDTLATIKRVANDALAELQRPFQPPAATRLAELDPLLQSARAAGLNVQLQLDGAESGLSSEAQFAAYRLVQEALTNVLKHAPGAAAHVSFATEPSYVDVSVINSPGAHPSHDTSGNGQGLRGMKQRVESCGGQLDWGPRPGGGFEVRARFPVGLSSVPR